MTHRCVVPRGAGSRSDQDAAGAVADVLSDFADELLDESEELPDDELLDDSDVDDDSLADDDLRESVR